MNEPRLIPRQYCWRGQGLVVDASDDNESLVLLGDKILSTARHPACGCFGLFFF